MSLSPEKIEAIGEAVAAWRVQEVGYSVLRKHCFLIRYGSSILPVRDFSRLSLSRSPNHLNLLDKVPLYTLYVSTLFVHGVHSTPHRDQQIYFCLISIADFCKLGKSLLGEVGLARAAK